MRTLKKTLCLVLAMTMVFGFFGIASAKGASDFPDYDDVQYKEAIDVMTGIDVIDGMGDDPIINPAGKVTRAQAAKMVTYAILGADVANDLPVGASSFDDVNSYYDWAIPSIEYLADKGIVNGRSGRGGHYDPEGEVTAYEFAKMMLCAAGYGVNDEYKGDSWALNVAIDARQNGIFTGTNAGNLNNAATREECALYCFNGITDVCTVKYSKDTESYEDVQETKTVKDKDNNDKKILVDVTIGSKVYGLALSDTDTDAYERPASEWIVDETKAPNLTNPIASTAKTPVATFNDASYAKAFADYEFDADNLKIYSNGQEWIGNADGVDPAGTINDLKAAKLNGTGIELYNTDKEKDIDVIVMTQAFLAKVTDYTETKGTALGNFKVEVYNPWDAAASTVKTVNDTKKTDDLFDNMVAAELAKDDYILVYAKGGAEGEIMKFAATETVTGALSTYNIEGITGGFNGKLTVDDTEYTLASACVENEEKGFAAKSIESYLTKNVTLYFDEYGMVIGIIPEEVEETVNLAYFINAYEETVTGNYGDTDTTTLIKAQCVDMAGEEVIYILGEKVEKDPENPEVPELTANSVNTEFATEKLCTVTTEYNDTLKTDVATLEIAKSSNDKKVNVGTVAKDADEDGVAATSPTIAPKNYYSADTTFLFVDGTGGYDLKVTTATGAQEIPAKAAYSYYSTKAAADTNFIVKYVVVEGTPKIVESKSLMFVPQKFNDNNAVPYTNADGEPDIAYKNIAFIDGQPKLDVMTDNGADLVEAGFYTFSVDDETGIYTLKAAPKDAEKNSVCGSGLVTNVYGNYISTKGSLPALDLTDVSAKDAFIVDVPYLANMLQNNGANSLTKHTTLDSLNDTNVNVFYSFTTAADGKTKTITGIYYMGEVSVTITPDTLTEAGDLTASATSTVTGDTFTYQWLKNGAPIAEANAATYSVTEAGVYTCLVTANSGLKGLSNNVTAAIA